MAKKSWPEIASALGAALPPDRLHPAVLAWAAVPANQRVRWGVGFSGGPDSLALLLLLCAHWPERVRGGRIVALHFDHRLRGRASAADARWCARVCAALGVPLDAGRWEDRPAGGGVSEAQARAARLEFFAAAARRHRLAAWWFGHQQDDIAETLLMRLARGSGTAGLAAPRPVQAVRGGPVRLRPLLTLPKAAIVSGLRAAGAVWREDTTNHAATFARNRHRHRVVPAWMRAAAAEGPRDALAGAALTRERLEEDDTALEAWVDRLRALPGDGTLRVRPLRGMPRAVVRRALHRWLLETGRARALARAGFEDLLRAVEAGGDTRRSLGKNAFAALRRGRLRVEVTEAAPETGPLR